MSMALRGGAADGPAEGGGFVPPGWRGLHKFKENRR